MVKEPATILPIMLKTAESRPDKSIDVDLIYCRLANPLIDYAEAAWNDLDTILCKQDANDCRRQGCKSALFQAYWHKVAEGLRAQHSAGACSSNLKWYCGNWYCWI